MGNVPGVESVHDLHVRALTSGKNSLTAHVVHSEGVLSPKLILQLQTVLVDRFKVFHTTFQLERTPCAHSADGCNFTGPGSATAATEAGPAAHRH